MTSGENAVRYFQVTYLQRRKKCRKVHALAPGSVRRYGKDFLMVIGGFVSTTHYMKHLLASDVISSPQLSLVDGRLPVLAGPGFGFEIDTDAVAKAVEE